METCWESRNPSRFQSVAEALQKMNTPPYTFVPVPVKAEPSNSRVMFHRQIDPETQKSNTRRGQMFNREANQYTSWRELIRPSPVEPGPRTHKARVPVVELGLGARAICLEAAVEDALEFRRRSAEGAPSPPAERPPLTGHPALSHRSPVLSLSLPSLTVHTAARLS